MTDTPNPESPARVGTARRSPAPGRSRWVTSLAVASMLVAVTACSGDDDDDAADAPSTEELDAAVERAEAAEAEAAELADELATVTETADEATAELAAAQEDVTAAQDELALAQVQLEATTQRAETAEARVAEIEEVAGQFPISLDSSLIPDDMPGRYNITFQEAYCDGFATCGTVPGPTTAEIYFTSEQFLRIGVTGILDAGLFALDGSLYGITDSFTALAPCNGQDRRARITVTLYAGEISVLDDGTRVVNDVNASITIDAPDGGPDCPSGLVFYASSLIPAG